MNSSEAEVTLLAISGLHQSMVKATTSYEALSPVRWELLKW
jgi:hypothetical protein